VKERIQLSENFFLDEFTMSQTASRLGQVLEIEPGSELHRNIEHLCVTVLQPLRGALNRSVHVTSGWRPEWLNLALHGSDTSDHILALAADIVVPGLRPLAVCEIALELNLPFKQLIHEFEEWTHLSAPPIGKPPIREVLTAYKRRVHGRLRTAYAQGLHSIETLTA